MAPPKRSTVRPSSKGKQTANSAKPPRTGIQHVEVKKKAGGSATQRRVSSAGKVAKTKASSSSTTAGGGARIKKIDRRLSDGPAVRRKPKAKDKFKSKAAGVAEAGSDPGDPEADDRNDGIQRMPVLEEKTKRISIAILEKLNPLPEQAQKDIVELLKAVERPVYMTYRNDRRREEAQQVLQVVVRKLCNKLVRAPAPPIMVKDKSLKFEKIVEHNREMEMTLEPDLHQITQLQEEIERERTLLERDRKANAELKANAATEEIHRREQTRKFHRILGQPPNEDEIFDGADNFKPLPSKFDTSHISSDMANDEEVLVLRKHLQQHLENVHKNAGALEPVGEWMKKTRAAIDEVFCRVGDDVSVRLNEV